MKNDTTFVRIRIGDHLGNQKMSKMGTSLRRMKLFYKEVRKSTGKSQLSQGRGVWRYYMKRSMPPFALLQHTEKFWNIFFQTFQAGMLYFSGYHH